MTKTKRSTSQEIAKIRSRTVIKSNELIQRRTHLLSVQEQKIILFLISQLRPDQKDFEYQVFDIIDFCEACGIHTKSGKNYNDLRKAIQGLRDKSMWIIGEKKDTLISWIQKAEIEYGSGTVNIMFDPDMKPFLLELKNKYTQFDLIYTLTMRSKYSVRLYEILKSYEKIGDPIQFSLSRFKELVGAEYEEWYDIKRRIVEAAIKEINEVGDMHVLYTTKKKGKAIIGITFSVKPKRKFHQQVETRRAIESRMTKGRNASEKPEKTEPPMLGQLTLDGENEKQ